MYTTNLSRFLRQLRFLKQEKLLILKILVSSLPHSDFPYGTRFPKKLFFFFGVPRTWR